MRRYHIQDRDDYKKYNKIVGMITKLTNILKQLDAKDATRIELTDQLLEKWVWGVGVFCSCVLTCLSL
jgi:U3 small nucleolar ribonucleoprotein protein IMP3